MADYSKDELNEVFGTDEGEWKEATNSEFENWDWDDPKCKILIGLYTKKKTDVGENNSNVYEIEIRGEARTVSVWGSTVLDTKFEKINVGEEVRIEYLGLVSNKKGGREYRDFKVFHRIPAMKEA